MSHAVPALQFALLVQPQVPLPRQAPPMPEGLQFWSLEGVQATHDFVVASHTLPLVQSESTRHATQACGSPLVSQTLLAPVQSVLVVHGSPMQEPTAPASPVRQNWPVGQLAVPDPRQPDTQTPVAVCEVLQYILLAQSLSPEHPQTPAANRQVGREPVVAHDAVLVAEHSVHCPASAPASPAWHAGFWLVGQLLGGGLLAA
jgi:hypothetical protein